MSELSEMRCVPCTGKEPALSPKEIQRLLAEVPGWTLLHEKDEPRLQKTYKFKNFAQALDFTNKVGQIAEEQDHHPALLTEWGKVTVTWWTHVLHGLHTNDFIMAARTDQQFG